MDLDLNIENYSLKDLYKLFHIKNNTLTEDVMKDAKKIVLKMHPDKSNLEPKYFLFFSTAYKKLFAIYEFQNKSSNKKLDVKNYKKDEKITILNNLFEKNKDLEKPENFNKWFNEQFDKHKIKSENEEGYGEWLKSNEGIYNTGPVSQVNMNTEFEKQKKQIQSISVYKGISDPFASALGGTILGKNADYSSGLFESVGGLQYQDLKQAHLETIIPITEEDYSNIPKFSSLQEYNLHRNKQDVTPMNETIAMKQLHNNMMQKEEESASLAFYYAKQSEEALQQHKKFWSSLNHLTNS
jgi:hypothetical protein